ncbi:hypothetical protein ACFLZV_01220 [Candidatus Margulisiibacteriota bacterium]
MTIDSIGSPQQYPKAIPPKAPDGSPSSVEKTEDTIKTEPAKISTERQSAPTESQEQTFAPREINEQEIFLETKLFELSMVKDFVDFEQELENAKPTISENKYSELKEKFLQTSKIKFGLPQQSQTYEKLLDTAGNEALRTDFFQKTIEKILYSDNKEELNQVIKENENFDTKNLSEQQNSVLNQIIQNKLSR